MLFEGWQLLYCTAQLTVLVLSCHIRQCTLVTCCEWV